MFIPGCGCCDGDGDGGPCQPCLYCAPSCLSVAFTGFSHGTENCGECDYLEDTTFIVKRPPAVSSSVGVTAVDADGQDEGATANGSGATFGAIGISSTGVMTNFARRTDGSYYVTGVTINSGGSNYDSPTLAFTVSGLIQCRAPTASVTVASGVITAVTVTEGGEYWPSNLCGYSSASDPVCAVCPVSDPPGDFINKRELWVSVSIGTTSNSVTLYLRDWYNYGAGPGYIDTAIVSASRSSFDENGNPVPCGAFVFSGEDITLGCVTNGTITLASVDCDSESVGYCEGEGNMPEQITLSLSGMIGVSISTGANFGGACRVYDENGNLVGFTDYEEFCGECGGVLHDIHIINGQSNFTVRQLVQQDFDDVVLDRVDAGCFWLWSGFAPAPPTETTAGNTGTFVNCNGELTVPVSVSIGPASLETTVHISPPTRGGEQATAEVTGFGEGGDITGVTITDGGGGYAAEIIDRAEPSMTVTLSGGAGSGAVLSATLTQSGTGDERYWYVSAVTVTNGGTGYSGAEVVVFTPEAGTTVESDASAYIVTGRTAPTITAAASGGSGASLSVTLTQSTDWQGLDVWGVSAVSVTSGGTGYTDGSAVTFTATDGVTYNAGSATITVGREEPTVTASVPAPSAGTGAVLAVTLTASGTSWTVSSLTITSGGSGYAVGDYIQLATGDTEESGGYAVVSSVDGSGAITAVTIYGGGSYYLSTGVIESVSIGWGGEYYKSTGVIESVVVGSEFDPGGGGVYYKLVPTGEVDADTPFVSFGSYIGTGATATATVDTDLESETFGQITGITVTDGGENYRLSGAGWLLSINIGTLNHLEHLLGSEEPPEPNEVDELDCANFWNQNQSIASRISLDPCPLELLSKSYAMSAGPYSGLSPHQGPRLGEATRCREYYICGPYQCERSTFFSFGEDPITCTISPG